MDPVPQNSITICLPPSVSLSEINADNLRNMVEAACQGSHDPFNQNGEIILYVKEQDMDLDQQFIYEPVSRAMFQEKIEQSMLEDPMGAVSEATFIQLQESGLLSHEAMLLADAEGTMMPTQEAGILHTQETGLLSTQDSVLMPTQDSSISMMPTQETNMMPTQETCLMPNQDTSLMSTQETSLISLQAQHHMSPPPPVIRKRFVIPSFEKQLILSELKPTPAKIEIDCNPEKKMLDIKQEIDEDDVKGPVKIDYEKLKKQKLTGPQGSKIFGCSVCSYRSATRTLLRQHMIIHADKKFQCKECKYRCHTASHLKRHMFIHSENKPIHCEQCGYSCTQNFQMKAHLIQHETDTPFVCKICNAVYKKEESLKVHMLGHENVTKFRCTQCNYAGNRYGDFKRHVLTHSSDKPLKCTVCSYACIRQWRLKAHMKIHQQDKPLLRCDLCDFSCLSAPRLKDHKVIHTNEGVIRCESCDFVCTQPSRLRRHMKVHSSAPQKTYTGTTYPAAYQQKMELEQAESEASNQPTYISLPAAQALELDGDWGAEQLDEDHFSAFAAFAGKQAGETYTITTTDGGQTYIIQTESPEQFAQQLAQAQFEQVQQIEALPDPPPDFTEIADIKPSPSKLKELAEEESPQVKKPPLNHSKSKRFHCDLCDFSCDYKSTFSAHQKKHSSVKKYKCAHCDYMCNDTSRMKDHLLCHTTEKMFQCHVLQGL
ncbi:zinc finger protein 425 [Biomphalaria pfeifferi]|uniref:Zinc finger protein 425 n=1 Tax=Biomphalaria pfeifferi TaxID=112525 RepID=A0AAD8B367_BIOPF|nr:zinc finger protein 425 [Biomphalaria pfeifferi]